jgi:phage terminase large subunit-like protein
MQSDPLEKAYQYAEDVLSGKIITGNLTRLAIQRNENDLKEAANRGLFFCEDSALRVLKFFNYLKHYQGKLAGQVIELEPWQCWNFATVFGWKKEETGARRFATAYNEVARKNGKTTALSGIGCYGLTKDNEGGPEIYAVAASRFQAGKLFKSAKAMVERSPALKQRLTIFTNEIQFDKNVGLMTVLSADAGVQDGLNPHMVLFDELHAQKKADLWNVLESSMVGSRSQSLMWVITTAGYNKSGICYEIRSYIIKVLQGLEENDAIFGLIYTLDEGDSWLEEENWIKANPNIGVSVDINSLRAKAKKAQVMPTAKVDFFIKHLNIWVSGATLWCNVEQWLKCGTEYTWDQLLESQPEALYFGLDLASVSDLCSLTGIAVMSDGSWKVIGKHYLPEEAVENNLVKSSAKYQDWADDGYLTVTPGNVTDYEWIKNDIRWLMERFNVREIAFDPFNSTQLVNDLLAEGVNMVKFRQGALSMNSPMRELERRYLSGIISHNNDPVINFAMSNVVAIFDPKGNMSPAKNKSQEKIDPAVALFMAVGRAMLVDETQDPGGCEIW